MSSWASLKFGWNSPEGLHSLTNDDKNEILLELKQLTKTLSWISWWAREDYSVLVEYHSFDRLYDRACPVVSYEQYVFYTKSEYVQFVVSMLKRWPRSISFGSTVKAGVKARKLHVEDLVGIKF
jgi:hypothetical protein